MFLLYTTTRNHNGNHMNKYNIHIQEIIASPDPVDYVRFKTELNMNIEGDDFLIATINKAINDTILEWKIADRS